MSAAQQSSIQPSAMWQHFASHLYLRIWLAVVATVVFLTFLTILVWRLTNAWPTAPVIAVELRNAQGEKVGTAYSQPNRRPSEALKFDIALESGLRLQAVVPLTSRTVLGGLIRLPPGSAWILGVVALAVALGTYPIIRRLTQRLEALQRGVERWGAGDLSARVQVDGRDEIAFLAKRFNHAAGQIESLMDSHKSLLANASHELRSPLARIRMAVELLAPSEKELAAKQEINRSIGELDQLIDEILLASRLDNFSASPAEAFESIDLTGLAAEECTRLQAVLLTGNHGVGTGHSTVVHGSLRLLRRLVRNLLENAQRHGEGEVVLQLYSRAASPGQPPVAVIRVSDHGPGVPVEQQKRIFEPFYRLPGASETNGGVGLGLALVKTISEKHGGTVRCENRPGGGASFVVELPLQEH